MFASFLPNIRHYWVSSQTSTANFRCSWTSRIRLLDSPCVKVYFSNGHPDTLCSSLCTYSIYMERASHRDYHCVGPGLADNRAPVNNVALVNAQTYVAFHSPYQILNEWLRKGIVTNSKVFIGTTMWSNDTKNQVRLYHILVFSQ